MGCDVGQSMLEVSRTLGLGDILPQFWDINPIVKLGGGLFFNRKAHL